LAHNRINPRIDPFFVTNPEKIEHLISALKDRDVGIVAFVRRPDAMFMSIYMNRLKKANSSNGKTVIIIPISPNSTGSPKTLHSKNR
jgi:hypothetical protein